MTDVVDRLRVALRDAMVARDRSTTSVLRSALAAIDNASAVPTTDRGLAIEEAAVGVGASYVARRQLDRAGVQAVIESEIADLEAAAHRYEDLGRSDEAAELRQGADFLRSHLS